MPSLSTRKSRWGAVMALTLGVCLFTSLQIADADQTDNRNQEIRFEAICPKELRNVTAGDDVLVPLQLINSLKHPINAKNMEIQFKFVDRNQVVHVYKEGADNSSTQDPRFKGRTFLRTDRIHEGHLELLVRRVVLWDNGSYTCYVRSKSFHSKCGFHINVSDKTDNRNQEIQLPLQTPTWCIGVTCLLAIVLVAFGIVMARFTNLFCMCFSKLKRKPREVAVPDQEGKQLLMEHEMDPLTQNLENQKKTSFQQHGIVPFSEVDVLLDTSNNSSKLWVSEDRKSVKLNDRPDGNKPRDNSLADSFILGCEGFTHGKHCWEVNVCLAKSWAVGIAQESVSQKYPGCLAPDEGVWAVGCTAGQCQAFTTPVTLLIQRDGLKKLKVYLDVDEGQLYFYDSDTQRHIYSHMWKYTEKVFPFIWTMDPNNLITVCSSSSK